MQIQINKQKTTSTLKEKQKPRSTVKPKINRGSKSEVVISNQDNSEYNEDDELAF